MPESAMTIARIQSALPLSACCRCSRHLSLPKISIPARTAAPQTEMRTALKTGNPRLTRKAMAAAATKHGIVKATLVERMCGCCIDIEYEWSGAVLPSCAGFCAAVLTGFFDFVEEPRRALSCQSAHHMSFALLDREIHGITLAAELRSLLLHLIKPSGIDVDQIHVTAE